MDLFQRAKAVRLRSHHDKFLLAEDDEERVCQHRNGTTRKARWQVELLDDDQPLIRLKSCYGRYLSASNEPFLLGFTGRKVLQVAPGRRLDSSLEWEPIRDGFQVKLKTRYGNFLRANGGPPPWRNTVTHDIPHLHHDWVLWEVDIVEVRAYIPTTVPEISQAAESLQAEESVESSPGFSKQESFSSSASNSPQKSFSSASSGSPRTLNSRIINYTVANNDGHVEANAEEFAFSFQGSSVEELTQKLEEETDLGHIIVCSRNPVNGKLYPLRLQLPPNKNTMNVVVILASSKAAKILAKQESPL